MVPKFGEKTLVFLVLASLLGACGEAGETLGDTNTELAHALGDAMGSVDEVLSRSMVTFVPMAGGSCYQASYTNCIGDERNVAYDACTLGPLTLTGEVSFVFSGGSDCALGVNGESVRRVPDFEITGRSGGTVGVTTFNPSSSGQTITRVSNGSYTYAVSGLRRYFKDASATRIADFTIKTTSDISITGTSRANRQMSGGTLEVLSNLDGSKLLMSPDALRWSARCSCAVSGSWVGQSVDADGETSDFVMKIVSCGNAEITRPEGTNTITLERCISI